MTTEAQEPETKIRSVRRRPSALTVLGIVLVAVGMACLGWVGYQYVGTDVVSQRSYDRETHGLREQWQSSPPGDDQALAETDGDIKPARSRVPGTAIALLRIPRFGANYEVPIVAGTELSDLAHGVGHYDSTAAPGEVGNFAVAGHRITHGQPFARLLTLKKGDEVVVETRKAVFTYVMDSSPGDLTVKDTAGWVLDPVPGKPDASATEALITLTTCQDLFHTPDRSIGFGHLKNTVDK